MLLPLFLNFDYLPSGDGDKDSDAEKHQIQSYEEAFSKIKEITAEEDIDKIVTDFIRKEDENFALFNYVNELNDEVERLQEEISSLNEDIESFNQEDVKLDDERKLMLKEMEVSERRQQRERDVGRKRMMRNVELREYKERTTEIDGQRNEGEVRRVRMNALRNGER